MMMAIHATTVDDDDDKYGYGCADQHSSHLSHMKIYFDFYPLSQYLSSLNHRVKCVLKKTSFSVCIVQISELNQLNCNS